MNEHDQCPACEEYELVPEHAHWRCRFCGFIEPCCEGAPA